MHIRYHNITSYFPSYRRISYCSASTLCVAVTAQVVAGAWSVGGVLVQEKGRRMFYCFNLSLSLNSNLPRTALLTLFRKCRFEVWVAELAQSTQLQYLRCSADEILAGRCHCFPFLQMRQLMWSPNSETRFLEELSIYLPWV